MKAPDDMLLGTLSLGPVKMERRSLAHQALRCMERQGRVVTSASIEHSPTWQIFGALDLREGVECLKGSTNNDLDALNSD